MHDSKSATLCDLSSPSTPLTRRGRRFRRGPPGGAEWPIGERTVGTRRPVPRPRHGPCGVRARRDPRAWSRPQHNLTAESNCRVAVHPSEVVIGGTGSLGRDHAGPDGGLGCTCRTEDLALPGLYDPLQDLPALTGLGARNPDSWYLVANLGVVFLEVSPQLERALRDESEASPLEVRTQLEHVTEYRKSLRIALFADDSRVLVLHLAPSLSDLAEQH